MIVSTAEEMNPHRRSTMEDCHVQCLPGTWGCNDPDIALFGIYDGHGGRDMVEFLEEHLVANVALELNNDDEAGIHERLERAFLITDIQGRMMEIVASGSTVTICLLKREGNKIQVHAANVGDTRAVLFKSSDESITRITRDHRADDPEEKSRIEKAGGFVLRNRVLGILSVTRSLGDQCMKEFVIARPYTASFEIDLSTSDSGLNSRSSHDKNKCISDNFLMIACDGVWDVIEDDEVVGIISNSKAEKKAIAQTFCDEALKRESTDNITALIVWF